MTVRHLTCALAATAALATTAAALPTEAGAQTATTANVGTCYYPAPSYQPSQVGWKAIQCLQSYSWWVDGSSIRLLKKLSPDAARVQQTGGLWPRVDVDWDPAKLSGSICCWYPAGWYVVILP